MQLATIGFTQRTAESFFTALKEAGVRRVVDVRLNNVSQLAGFAKRADLEYLAMTICHASYVHHPQLAPTAEMLKAYRSRQVDWTSYAEQYTALMDRRGAVHWMAKQLRDGDCLLCSEPKPERCHRRLLSEALEAERGDLTVIHL